ncbi:MAG: hypothetical protein GVY12_06645 [Bacteroidetes bacterium]|jgi:hypothetical protein|nr:hypothetical protein [Bacteroidota bacterium]
MPEHQGQTNEIHQITLPSAIEQVQWADLRAAPGGTVGLEVSTRYVGNGSTLQIKLTDHQGTTHGTFKDQLYGNRLTAEIQVPAKAREALYAEVKFPKHGLKQKSPALLLTPPVEVKNATWSQDEARRGDVLTLSADVEGVPDGTEAEITIFEHDTDGAHDPITRFPTLVEKERVEAEWEYEYHEDTDDVPTDDEAEQGYRPPEYFFRVDVEGVAAESDLLIFKDWIGIELLDIRGRPVPGRDYVLHTPDGTKHKGTLDDNGRAKVEDVPPGPYRVEFPE